MKDLYFYQEMAQEMVERDRGRDQMMMAMDQMWRGEWSLPPQMAKLRWVHKVVSTDPHDALRAGTRVLSSVEPHIKARLLGPSEKTREQTDQVERALRWHFRQASRRRRASVLRDIVLSALLYDEVVAQVVYLPHQVEALKSFNGDARRLEAAGRFGTFAVLVRNPREVHVRYSDWMPEAALMKRVMPVQEALDFWGKKANKLRRALDEGDAAELGYVTVYDYMDLESRVVWGILQEEGGVMQAPLPSEHQHGGVEILREEHGLGFLPWVAKVGGTTLAEDPAHQRVPLLYSVYQAKQWETQNIIETLMASEAIAYAAAPRLKVEGPTDEVEVDYGEPGRVAYVPPGHNLSQLNPPGMDSGLAAIADRVGERIGKSTVPRVLQTADFPAGAAFASLNLATQSGIKHLTPYKELAEEALADVMMQMLYWVEHSGQPLKAFSAKRNGSGEPVILLPGSARVEDISVEVELTADVPTDRMARINAASMAVRELGYSRLRALEQIGESDPDAILDEARAEALEQVELEIEKQKRMVMGQMSLKNLEDEAGEGEKTQEEIEREAFMAEVMKNPTARERMLGILRGEIELEGRKRKKGAFKTVGLTHEERTGEARKQAGDAP